MNEQQARPSTSLPGIGIPGRRSTPLPHILLFISLIAMLGTGVALLAYGLGNAVEKAATLWSQSLHSKRKAQDDQRIESERYKINAARKREEDERRRAEAARKLEDDRRKTAEDPVRLKRAEDVWQRLRNSTDTAALKGFIEVYAGTPRATEARARLEQVRAMAVAEWEAVKQNRSPDTLRRFEARFPGTPQALQSRDQRNGLAADEWRLIDGTKEAVRVEEFIRRHADTSAANQARGYLARLAAPR